MDLIKLAKMAKEVGMVKKEFAILAKKSKPEERIINVILAHVDEKEMYSQDFVDWYNSLSEDYFK